MKLIVSNIDWDYPGKDEGKECPSELPTQITIDDPELLKQLSGDDINTDDIAEYLTEKYKCCVCGFVPELEGVGVL